MKQAIRKSTRGMASRKQLATMTTRKSIGGRTQRKQLATMATLKSASRTSNSHAASGARRHSHRGLIGAVGLLLSTTISASSSGSCRSARSAPDAAANADGDCGRLPFGTASSVSDDRPASSPATGQIWSSSPAPKGVAVAVKCGDGAGLHAAQTYHCGNFHMAVLEAPASRCAARVLGGAEQLCAPQRLTVAHVVAAGRRTGSYVLGSRLAVFTRCGDLATMATAGGDRRLAPSMPRQPLQTPVRSRPRAGLSSPPYDLGLPLIYFFPFIPIIGIP